MADFPLQESLKLISRKIWAIQKSWNFHTVYCAITFPLKHKKMCACLLDREVQDFPHFIRNRNWFCTAFWTLNFRVGFYSDLTIKSCTFTVSIIRVSKYSFRRVRWKKKITTKIKFSLVKNGLEQHFYLATFINYDIFQWSTSQ